MITRRAMVFGGLLAALLPMQDAEAARRRKKRRRARKRRPFRVADKYKPQQVPFEGHEVGTLVVDPRNHFLYLVTGAGVARRYGVGVGRAGANISGTLTVARKAVWPFWRPTRNMIRRSPRKYARYARGMKGGPRNPLGARALYLYRGGKDTMYRIHGTTRPSSIGRSVSNGCIRMINDHVVDLYKRVPVGTKVVII